jgi:UDP-N-acetylglucosamine diphosphorylase/glucosamine-1-phosphate N-acetyltransferase
MRPLSWGTPVFELRCGMFNTRERIGLRCDLKGGVLLGREMLCGLHTASGWKVGAEALSCPEWEKSRFLFLNGMLAPDFSLIHSLMELAADGPGFVWRTDEGLVAALVDAQVAARLGEDWAAWERDNARCGAWTDPARLPGPWSGDTLLAFDEDGAAAGKIIPGELESLQAAGPRWIWDIVRATRRALAQDLTFVREGVSFRREPFGIFPAPDKPGPDWLKETTLAPLATRLPAQLVSGLGLKDPHSVFSADGVDLAPGTALNTAEGPIVLDRGVRVMPHCYLEGPLYIGPGSLVKPGTRIHGESSFGIVNRLAGEIAESTFGDFANKQHEGFIGHAVLGSWINLGAMTTCSDLKNNYGEIRVDLGSGDMATGERFVGLMMGDHAKTAIGTLFNTGTSVGFATNIFGTDMPPKHVGNFLWGGQKGCPSYSVDRARQTAGIVMGRRGCLFSPAHGDLFEALA